jgi:hypothetical protein
MPGKGEGDEENSSVFVILVRLSTIYQLYLRRFGGHFRASMLPLAA